MELTHRTANPVAAESPITVQKALQHAVASLEKAGWPDAKTAAEWLLSGLLQWSRTEIYAPRTHRLTASQSDALATALTRATQHEPVQYILGYTEFMGLTIHCDARALIPRPETEQLVEWVVSDLQHHTPDRAPVVVDVGTGTGCIALSIASLFPHARVTGVDIDPEALTLARENAARLALACPVRFEQGDLLAAWKPDSADVLVANLPYIPRAEWQNLPPNVRLYEPEQALIAGDDGLEGIRRLAPQAYRVLRTGGRCYGEIGECQGTPVRKILQEAGFADVNLRTDWSGRDRMVCARR